MALTKVTGSVIKDSVSLSGNVSVGGTLTYQDVTNVDALGIGTFRTGIKVLAGQVDVGSNIKLGNAGVITATSFSGVMSGTTGSFSGQVNVGSNIKLGTAGVVTATSFSGSGANLTSLPAANLTGTLPAISGANLTSLPAQATVNNNADNRVITGGSGVNLYAESGFTYDGTTVQIPDRINCNTNGTYLKENQLSFNPTGTAYLDHYRTGQDIQIRMSTSSSLDTTGPTFKSNGNLAFASGKGIDFSATGDASGASQTTSSELFDDYEEGSWTPVIAASAANPSFTFVSGFPRGRYRKIGGQVTLWYDIAWSGLPSQGGGTLQMQNFPYSTSSAIYHGGGLMSHTVGTNAGGAYTGKHTHYANPSSSFMYILSGASTNGHMQCTALNTSGHIFGFFTFAT